MPSDLCSDETGAALLEAALVLPLLLLLVFGLVDISLYFWTTGLAAKAVQLGARRAVISDSVAVGPGLDRSESASYWDGLPPGAQCFTRPGGASICPEFSVKCDVSAGCRCNDGGCRFRLSAARLKPILEVMQTVMPELRPENVQVSYATNGLGYVTRPVPVPVDVRVSLIGLSYKPMFLSDFLSPFLTLHASAQLPSEDLLTSR